VEWKFPAFPCTYDLSELDAISAAASVSAAAASTSSSSSSAAMSTSPPPPPSSSTPPTTKPASTSSSPAPTAPASVVATTTCTYSLYGRQYIEQPAYQCMTCFPGSEDSDKFMCSACARMCHREHDLIFGGTRALFCDCFQVPSGRPCQCTQVAVAAAAASASASSSAAAAAANKPTSSLSPALASHLRTVLSRHLQSALLLELAPAVCNVLAAISHAVIARAKESAASGSAPPASSARSVSSTALYSSTASTSLVPVRDMEQVPALSAGLALAVFPAQFSLTTAPTLSALPPSAASASASAAAAASAALSAQLARGRGRHRAGAANQSADEAHKHITNLAPQLLATLSPTTFVMAEGSGSLTVFSCSTVLQHLRSRGTASAAAAASASASASATEFSRSDLTILSTVRVPFRVYGMSVNPRNREHVLVWGKKHCQVIVLDSKGRKTDRVVIDLSLDALQGASYGAGSGSGGARSGGGSSGGSGSGNSSSSPLRVLKAEWVPDSQVWVAVSTNQFVKMYDLSRDTLAPVYVCHMEAPNALRDSTLALNPFDRAVTVFALASNGTIFCDVMVPDAGPHEFVYPLSLGAAGTTTKFADGKSIYYSQSCDRLFASFATAPLVCVVPAWHNGVQASRVEVRVPRFFSLFVCICSLVSPPLFYVICRLPVLCSETRGFVGGAKCQ
jgi:hypothetical protein